MHNPHAATATAGRSFDDDGIAYFSSHLDDLVEVVTQRPVGTRHTWDPGGLHGLDSGHLVAHEPDCARWRANECEAA